jgi:preprotein translocase subunit SecA
LPVGEWLKSEPDLHEETLRSRIIDAVHAAYDAKIVSVDREAMRHYERAVMLQSLDTHWREHLSQLDYLRQGIHLRGYAQKNPKQEYKREAFELFADMLQRIKGEYQHLLTVQVRSREEVEQAERLPVVQNVQYQHADFAVDGASEALADGDVAVAEDDVKQQPFVRRGGKVGRNDPCPCGSGKKYKHCHGRLT